MAFQKSWCRITGHSFLWLCMGSNTLSAAQGFRRVTKKQNGQSRPWKNLLKKAGDPYLALLTYRATPLQNGYSPAQLFLGRRLRTMVPTLPSQLDPRLPDSITFAWQEKEKRMSDAANYNRRHCAEAPSVLSPGERVWVTDAELSGTVLQNHSTWYLNTHLLETEVLHHSNKYQSQLLSRLSCHLLWYPKSHLQRLPLSELDLVEP